MKSQHKAIYFNASSPGGFMDSWCGLSVSWTMRELLKCKAIAVTKAMGNSNLDGRAQHTVLKWTIAFSYTKIRFGK